MATKKLLIYYELVEAPAGLRCGNRPCQRNVPAGKIVVCIVIKKRYSYKPAERQYYCSICTRAHHKIVRHREQEAAKRRAAAAKRRRATR